jgi:tetratricopeptide (TPR) repeat protein
MKSKKYLAIIFLVIIAIFPCSLYAEVRVLTEEDLYSKIPEPEPLGVLKSPQMKAADKRFIDDAVQLAGSKKAAAVEMVQKAWNYYNDSKPVIAMMRFNQAYLLDPDNADIYWGFGKLLLDQQRYHEAIGMLDRSAALNSNNSRVYYLRAGANCLINDFDKAFSDYDRAIGLDPNNGAFYYNRAWAYFKIGQYDKSWQDVEKAKQIGTNIAPDLLDNLKEKGYGL